VTVSTHVVVRHASAGDRRAWHGDDRLRPLDDRGRRQAGALGDTLARLAVARLVSSPYARCTETLEPAAQRLAVDLEESELLAEGSSASDVIELLSERPGSTTAVCTHGDVLEALFGRSGAKGSARVVRLVDGRLVELEYLPPAA
jgi:8-oxo-(d)GTP phosphatase